MQRFLLRLILFSVIAFAVLELFFRFAVPGSSLPFTEWEPPHWIRLHDPHRNLTGTYSFGRLAEVRGRWRVNNAGWVSTVDYLPLSERRKPLVAILGDSFVEAVQTDVDDRFDSVLLSRPGRAYDVYALGVGGCTLSHNIPLSRYAQERFRPDVVVVVVTRTSLRESMAELRRLPLSYQIRRLVDGGFEELPNVPPQRQNPFFRSVSAMSALLKYLRFNARVELAGLVPGMPAVVAAAPAQAAQPDVAPAQPEVAPAQPEVAPAGSSTPDLREQRARQMADLRTAAVYIVRRIREENAGSEVAFVMDADKSLIYPGGRSWDPGVREAVAYGCAQNGVPLVDLQQPFQESYASDGEVLDLVIDRHWNEKAHRVVAEALAPVIDSLLARRTGPADTSLNASPPLP